MKLFENIDGNRFKLSETKIISEVPELRKQFLRLLEAEEKANPNIITREEEQRALQVIRQQLIGPAVKSFNLGMRHVPTQWYAPTDEEFVRKNLKKVMRRRNPKDTDLITYDVNISEKYLISFEIEKNKNSLTVAYFHQFHDYDRKGPKRITISKYTLNEEKDDFRISKEEEAYSHNYMIRRVIPLVVNEMYTSFLNKFPSMYPERKFPRITAKDVYRNLKKQRTDVDQKTYEAVINNNVYFTFIIKKKIVKTEKPTGMIETPTIMIGVQGPINTDWKWYAIKRD